MEEVENALSQIADSRKGNFLTGLLKIRKKSLLLGLLLVFVIFVAAASFITGFINSDSVSVLEKKPPTNSNLLATNQSNLSSIEVRIISSSEWKGRSEIVYLDDIKSLGGGMQINGTGNKTFKVDGDPVSIGVEISKIYYDDESYLAVELVVNGNVIKRESTVDTRSESVRLTHDFAN